MTSYLPQEADADFWAALFSAPMSIEDPAVLYLGHPDHARAVSLCSARRHFVFYSRPPPCHN
eukprot:2969718-Amphidinium_carterae.1